MNPNNHFFSKHIILLFVFFALLSCQDHYVPKPWGYYRITIPAPEYDTLDSLSLPYSFLINKKLAVVDVQKKDSAWINLVYPSLKARIFFTYKTVGKNKLDELIKESENFVYKHTIKADTIDEEYVGDSTRRCYGFLFDIKGNAASNIQFYATDSTTHFLRGALYFDVAPNADSLRPSVKYLRNDIEKIIHTINWK